VCIHSRRGEMSPGQINDTFIHQDSISPNISSQGPDYVLDDEMYRLLFLRLIRLTTVQMISDAVTTRMGPMADIHVSTIPIHSPRRFVPVPTTARKPWTLTRREDMKKAYSPPGHQEITMVAFGHRQSCRGASATVTRMGMTVDSGQCEVI
jgi:hypothetical protein